MINHGKKLRLMRSELLETENIFFIKIVPDLSKKLITLVDKLLNLITLLIGAKSKPPKILDLAKKVNKLLPIFVVVCIIII